MQDFYARLGQLLRHDPGRRGLAAHAAPPDLAELSRQLFSARRTLILTGFPIASAGAGETDGPPGAANIARALLALGRPVWLVTDRLSAPIVAAAGRLRAPQAALAVIDREGSADACRALLAQIDPTHCIAIERPGRCGGHFRSGRGLILDPWVADTDPIFASTRAVTVAIGDGGNELGMGSLRAITARHTPGGAPLAADLGCHFPLAAGVSNWWGWGLAALLSVAAGRELLPSDAQETALLEACVAAGAVDGMSGRPAMTVDGLSLAENLAMLARIRALTREFLPDGEAQ